MRPRLFAPFFVGLILLLVSACQNSVQQPSCFSIIPDGVSVTCGVLDVPEDYAQPDKGSIHLHYAVVHKANSTPTADPVVFLAGGPGEHTIDSMPLAAFAPYLENHDVVLFDQRGVGKTEPALECPAYAEAVLKAVETRDSVVEIEAVKACLTSLRQTGVNLAAYTTANNARDLDQLRQHLGYSQWNLLASSYGTQLALTAAPDTPAGIRAIILDSIYPVEKPLFDERSVNGAAVLDSLFAACAAQADCASHFPNLHESFIQLIDQLDTSPVSLRLTTTAGQTVDAQLTGAIFASLVYNMLYNPATIVRIPQMITDTASGNYAAISEGVIHFSLLLESTTFGMQFAVLCNDETPFDTDGAVQASDYPGMDAYFQQRKTVVMSICKDFAPTTPSEQSNQPITTPIPTLILSGAFDPVTPSVWAEAVAQTLPNSFYVQFPTLGHGIALDACPAQIAVAFLNTPTKQPDTSCVQPLATMQFTIRPEAYTLVPFNSQNFGLSGVYPEGWIHREEADFYQDESRFTSLIYINYRAKSLDAVMQQILPSYQLTTPPPLLRTYPTDELTFNLYQFVWQQRLTITLAMAEKDGDTYMVALASPMSDHPALYDLVLLPALDQLRLTGS